MAARAIGPALPIVSTVIWLMLGAVAGVLAPFTIFLFDPGADAVSVWTWLIFLGVMATVVLCLVSILAGWLAWALTRRRSSGLTRVLRGTAYLLPLLGIALLAVGFLGSSLLCSGSLTCT
jgi:uncharacterized membrane protein YeaQ/YmgE (transglycosylase-associated protein family)